MMMVRRLAGAAALALLVAGAGGGAEARNRHELGVEPVAVQAMRNFALCVVRRSPRGAIRLLAMDDRGADYGRALDRLVQGTSDCVPDGRLGFSAMLFAGGLAEGLLQPRLRHGALAPLVAYDPARPPIVARDSIEGMALCAVRQAPAETQALLATEPGTGPEQVAARALTSALVACLGEGETMRLNRPAIRALLAMAAYRLVDEVSTAPAD